MKKSTVGFSLTFFFPFSVFFRFPGQLNQTQCRHRLTTAALFLRNCVGQPPSRGDGLRHRCTLQRNTASMMKI